jgi:hypothetical protein
MGLLPALQDFGCSATLVDPAIFFWHSAAGVLMLRTHVGCCSAASAAEVVALTTPLSSFKGRELGD